MLRSNWERCLVLFLLLLLLTGLFLAVFPIVWGAAMDKTICENAQLFLRRDEYTEPADSYVAESLPEETMPYAQLWEEMTAYNQTIYTQGQTGLSCEYAYEQVENIVGQVGMTPQGWNSGIFSMIQNLSSTVILPIAGAILAIVMTLELIQLITDKNNLNDDVC